ncbi:hypothetical protein [Glaciimonas sp. PCH181]|uniref:hypothetical protein n=1 Tax=Glaciimonas sp. PCH181 TaxID=2133943 RepID=UPI0011B1CEB4|nr:hypothetical protein [Glaciimonas sp. PCH181]
MISSKEESEARANKYHSWMACMNEARANIAKAVFSPQANPFPERNAQQVLRLAGELVAIAGKEPK